MNRWLDLFDFSSGFVWFFWAATVALLYSIAKWLLLTYEVVRICYRMFLVRANMPTIRERLTKQGLQGKQLDAAMGYIESCWLCGIRPAQLLIYGKLYGLAPWAPMLDPKSPEAA